MSCLIKFISFSDYNRNNQDNRVYQINYMPNSEDNLQNNSQSSSPNNQILFNSNNLTYRNHLFSKKNEKNCFVYPGSLIPIYNSFNNNDECSICLEIGTDTVLKCGHIYHYKCMLEWLKICIQNKTDLICPYCRAIECKK